MGCLRQLFHLHVIPLKGLENILPAQVCSLMSITNEHERLTKQWVSISLCVTSQKTAMFSCPLSEVMESVISTICSLSTLLCVTSWPAVLAPLLSEYLQVACQAVKQSLSSVCSFLCESGFSRSSLIRREERGQVKMTEYHGL